MPPRLAVAPIRATPVFRQFFQPVGFNQVPKKSLENFVDSSLHPTYRLLMKENLLTAVADSAATGLPVDVAISFESVDAAITLLRSRFVDVDYDTFPNRVTIFGDDQRIEGDEDEGLWVLNLVFAPAPARFGDVNAI
jgi:hypothetical protein